MTKFQRLTLISEPTVAPNAFPPVVPPPNAFPEPKTLVFAPKGLLVAALLFDDPNTLFVVLFDPNAFVVVVGAPKALLFDPNELVALLFPKAEVMCVQKCLTNVFGLVFWLTRENYHDEKM